MLLLGSWASAEPAPRTTITVIAAVSIRTEIKCLILYLLVWYLYARESSTTIAFFTFLESKDERMCRPYARWSIFLVIANLLLCY